MTETLLPAPIIILGSDPAETHQIAGWLRGAGLSGVSTARSCDEAIFMLGRAVPGLLVIDESIPASGERRLLNHLVRAGSPAQTALVRLAGEARGESEPAGDRAVAAEQIRRPLTAHDVVSRIGRAMRRPDLIGRLDNGRDQAAQHLETARQMQIGLLPTESQLRTLHERCDVGVAALYRSGEVIGGDFWGIWPTGRGRFALAIADFAGHGLSAAVNTFRLHALLSEETLPRGQPTRMTALLNARLHALLPRGQYATMIYLHIDPATHGAAWCSAGGPPPMFVSAEGGACDLDARGLPLGIRAGTAYRRRWMRFPGPGILVVFTDGLLESGSNDPEVPRSAIAATLAGPARRAASGDLAAAAGDAAARLEILRDLHPCPGHSDDIVAICVAFGDKGPVRAGDGFACTPLSEKPRRRDDHRA